MELQKDIQVLNNIEEDWVRSYEQEQVLMNLTGRYVVKAVFAREGRLVVELQKDIQVLNNIEEDWVRSYEQETGEDISFF